MNFLIVTGLVLTGAFVGVLLPSREKSATVEECKTAPGSRCRAAYESV